MFEEPLSDDGLFWDELVAWWARVHGGNPKDPNFLRALGMRLRESLGSDVEKHLFDSYFQRFHPVLEERLPALIPQVYLHYDPITVKQLHHRGENKRFSVQRMDFLLLLPERVRIVLEVDGQQHYSDGEGKSAPPNTQKYAETVKGDRLLRLAGYEVYRFGGHELYDKKLAGELAQGFFNPHAGVQAD